MTDNEGKKVKWKDMEIFGDTDYCIDFIDKYRNKIEKEVKEEKSSEFTPAQISAMFNLNEEGKKILKFIKNYHKQHTDYPTPKTILNNLYTEKNKNVNYITRDKMKNLSRFVESIGKFKGKKIRFTKEFSELK